jgi:hypothetical protein
MSTVVIKGKVRGSWKRTIQKETLQIEVKPIEKFTPSEKLVIEKEARRFARFLKIKAKVVFV